MKTELETLRAELHKEVDAKIDKLIKPKELNRWYKCKERGFMMFAESIDERRSGEYYNGYGFYNGVWFKTETDTRHLDDCILMTPTEVQEALEKEAVKRLKGKKFTDARGHGNKYDYDKNFEKFYYKDGILCIQGNWNGTVFFNGTWATPKTMTIDEIISSLNKGNGASKIKFLAENKTQIIETLNNL